MIDAILIRADLIGANLIGANLIGAKLTGANLADAIFDETTTMPDGRKWRPAAELGRRRR